MKNKDSTIDVGANAVYQTEWLRNLTDKSQMNIGIFFAIIAVVVIWFLMKKTTLGFEIRAVGLNANAAEYAGMSAKRTIILSMIISGALAGIGGVAEGLGLSLIHIWVVLRCKFCQVSRLIFSKCRNSLSICHSYCSL